MSTTTEPLPTQSTFRLTAIALAAAFALLWGELFLTADAEDPNTWSGVITDTVVLAVAGAVALGLAAAHARGRGRSIAVAAFVLTFLFALPFWTGAAIVLGATAYLLNRGQRPALAYIAAAIAGLVALFLMVSIFIDFAPGLPS